MYDELGRLSDKRLHASNYDGASAITVNSTFNYLQSLDYTYNIWGWMTAINDVSTCATQSGDQVADLFKLQLSYDAPAGGSTFSVIDNLTYAYSTTIPDRLIAMTDAGNITKVISLITINLVTIKNKFTFIKMIHKHKFPLPHIILLLILTFFYTSNVYYWITINKHGGYEYKPGFFYPKASMNYFFTMIIHSFLLFLFILRYKNAILGRTLFVFFTILCTLYLIYYLYSEFYFISYINKLLYISILLFLIWAFINDIQ